MPYKDPEKQRKAQAKHYLENKGKYSESSKRSRRNKYKKIQEIKDTPCMDCGKKYPPYIMEFDHVTGDKVEAISWLIQNASWQAVLDEIDKCDLVCANCHRERTYSRLIENGTACMYID